MGIVRVQGNTRGLTNTSTLVVEMPSTPISGNILILTFGATQDASGYTSGSSISQPGVTWTKQIQSTYLYNTYGIDSEIWAGVVGAGASTTITMTTSLPTGYGEVANVCEYSGLLTSNFLDKTASLSGSSASTSTGTTDTTTQASELWIGSILVFYYDNVPTQSAPTNGFTLLDGADDGSLSEAYLEYISSSTGTANTGTTIAAGVDPWAGCIATFKASATTATVKTYYGDGLIWIYQ